MSEKGRTMKVSGSSPVKETAGSIVKTYLEDGIDEIELRAIGASAVNQMYKALATARSIFALNGKDFYVKPGYKETDIGGDKRTVMIASIVIK